MSEGPKIEMTREELKALMSEAVRDAFTKMGIDADDPLEMQRDFQHLREWRVAVAAVRTKGMLTLFGVFLTGALGALWLGFKSLVNGP
ncbi:hypothetical protein Pan1_24 [Pseudanabaena phage Pan1]|nr:hypothetical protein Pan1_24 [Pseudanabaena phage Pan1]